jgi:hypothetical protein
MTSHARQIKPESETTGVCISHQVCDWIICQDFQTPFFSQDLSLFLPEPHHIIISSSVPPAPQYHKSNQTCTRPQYVLRTTKDKNNPTSTCMICFASLHDRYSRNGAKQVGRQCTAVHHAIIIVYPDIKIIMVLSTCN